MNDPISARKRIYRIALDAMFIAVFVILSMVPSEISWASLPVILCAFLLRPTDTLIIAACGSFIEQLWYGLNFTSLVWMMPWVLFAVFVGLGAAWARRSLRVWRTVLVIVLSELLLNIGNTSALLYFGYVTVDPSKFESEFPLAVVALLTYLVRMPQAIVRAILSSAVIPWLLPPLRKTLARIC